MRWQDAYDKTTEIVNRDIGYLFQKLNFFLVITAFFITGFGAIFSIGSSSSLMNVDYIISAAGIIISVLFASANYISTRIIFQTDGYIREIEGNQPGELIANDSDKPYIRINQIVQRIMNRSTIISVFWDMLWAAMILIFRPRISANRGIADHTYILPLLFAVFWMCLIVFLALSAKGIIE